MNELGANEVIAIGTEGIAIGSLSSFLKKNESNCRLMLTERDLTIYKCTINTIYNLYQNKLL